LAAAVALSTTLTPLAANADTSNVTRIGGYDKFETAALMAQKGWPGTSDNVVLSAGMNYNLVDALAAGPLAAKLNAPIILTDGGESLNSFAKAELQRLKPKKAYITSGTAVIKPAVINELIALGITPVPLGGYDQYETSVNIAQELAKQGVDISQVVLTGGWASPVDALSVSSIAAAQEMPILTTKQGQLPAVVKTYLDSIKAKVTDAYVIGGTAVVADAVTDQLPGKVSRYAGLTN
jgi:putative cell wall-binding protein